MSEISRYTAGIPPLHTVKDPDTRRVLEALVVGWRARNGDLKPSSDERFITKGELKSLVEAVNEGYFAKGSPGYTSLQEVIPTPNLAVEIRRALDQVQRDVFNDPLWNELGERVRLIDLSLVTEQRQRVAAVQAQADALAAEAAARLGFEAVVGSEIARLEETDADQATLIEGLTTRTTNAESTIVSLQQTTATQAVSLTSLETRVGDSESNITDLQTTTSTQAQSLESLSTRVGSSETNISTLQTTTANQASTLQTLTADVASNSAAITTEQSARANADNAITSSVTTQFSSVNSSLAALQTSNNTLTNSVSSLASTVTTLQASVGDNTAAISNEASVRATADGQINAKYTVKLDTNGYVSGFGLISTANNSTPISSFIVRADRFAIGSPSGPGITPTVPFVVRTTTDSNGNPPGAYIENAVIGRAGIVTANIAEGNIDTLRLAGEAVFVSRWATGVRGTTVGASYVRLATLSMPIRGLPSGATAPVILQAYVNYSPSNNAGASVYTNIAVNGVIATPSFGVSVFASSVFAGNSAQVNLPNSERVNLPNGAHLIELLVNVGSPGVASKYLYMSGVLTASSGKR